VKFQLCCKCEEWLTLATDGVCLHCRTKALAIIYNPPLTDAQKARGEGVARAVANLNRHESRLGASRWQP
jgi:hypothetical protein